MFPNTSLFLPLNDASRSDASALFTVVLLFDLPQLGHRYLLGDACGSSPGDGLGLSVAAAELHGGSLRPENAVPGLRASFALSRSSSGCADILKL